MGYVTVKQENEEHLTFCREPTLWSWSILTALVAFALGAAYYGSDPFLWKAAYVIGGVAVGLSFFEDWEECSLDKTADDIHLKKQSVWSKLFPTVSSPQIIVSRIDDIVGVQVQEENVRYFGKGHQVVLLLKSGIALGITESFTFGDTQEHYATVEKIKTFLDLDLTKTLQDQAEDLDDSSSGESFEQIEHMDVISEEQAEHFKEKSQEIQSESDML